MMPKFNVLKDFKGSPDGYTVIDYKKGETVELEGDLAKVALEEKWVKPSKAEKEAKAKAEAEAEEAARLKTEAIADLQAELAQLNTELAAADANADTDGILAQIGAKQTELDALLA